MEKATPEILSKKTKNAEQYYNRDFECYAELDLNR